MEMETQLNEKDFAGLRKSNHKIKGASSSLFSTRVGVVSVKLEEAIDLGDAEGISTAFTALKEETDCLASFFKTISAGFEDGSDEH